MTSRTYDHYCMLARALWVRQSTRNTCSTPSESSFPGRRRRADRSSGHFSFVDDGAYALGFARVRR